MICDVWSEEDGTSVTVIPHGELERSRHLFIGQPKLLRTIEADTWEEIMIKHQELMGWERYNAKK